MTNKELSKKVSRLEDKMDILLDKLIQDGKPLREWIAPLEKEPKKEEFEVGVWYKSTSNTGKSFVFCTKIDGDKMYGYGFDCSGYWTNEDGAYWVILVERFKKATPQEVEEALIKEAENRGFKEVAHNFKDVDNGIHSTPLQFKYLRYSESENWLCDGYGNVIFSRGQWATIIEDKYKFKDNYEVKVNGYDVEIGCSKFNKADVEMLHQLMQDLGLPQVFSSALNAHVSRQDLKELIDYINK